MTSPLENIEALMPFKVVYVSQESGQWFDSTSGIIYRKLPEGMVYKVAITSHSSGSPTLHISTGASASTRLRSTSVPAEVENKRLKEIVVKQGEGRWLSVVGSGTPGDEITVELIPMLITEA